MKIIGIVATGRNFEIGKKNGLLFELKEDMKHFKSITDGHFVVCGYNTLLSFPNSKPLKNRIHIVIAPPEVSRDDCIIVHTLDECLKTMREISINDNTEFFIIGGGMVYNSFLPYYDKVIVTKVDAEDAEATVFFPNLDKEKDFKIIAESEVIKDQQYNIKYVTYERIK